MPIISKTPILKGPTTKTETKSSLPVILILFALIAGLLFYFQILKPSQVNEYGIFPDLQKEYSSFKVFKNLSLDFSIFDRIDFKELRIFGEVPVKPSPGGKTDLFSP
ncbi:MAG: hypothetical protein G01um10142_172 [Parcubacteria group bacterium Gr01-1014_2]|nr:MAG: hypothetical protein G01um10142_172 [Parcubacteria group bacterium Gr01-1014_2]